jgi:serine/threonine protein kinase
VILGFLAAAVALAALIFLFAKLFGLTWRILGNIFRFIGSEIGDTLRFVGAVLSGLLFAPLVVLNIVIGRWSASKHFANAFWAEMSSAGSAVYRLFVGNPARLFGLGSALEGIEQRVPQAMAAAPGKDKPAKRVGQFDGYSIVGSLQGGGSGSRLYIAEPDPIKRAGFVRQGLADVDRVVIKVFSLKDGSSLPQIVRESRALDAAKKLGLVLEHELTPERFFYVMRYVPGDSLAVVTQRLHAESPAEGLDGRRLSAALGYACDLLASLDAYHRAGLWHKDVKPDNIIVDGQDHKAHLVDFGLVTPLRSAMTLTTHGTEYFRDPELVRQALRGVKVHQIDGSKFDIYAAGAVLFSVIENSFPAHGGLSQTTKRCPEALRWIVRRAMTDYDRRYTSAAEMLADLRVVQAATDPFKLKPIDLPSVSGRDNPEPAAAPWADEGPAATPFEPARMGVVGGARGNPVPPPTPGTPAGRPNLTVSDWWSGRYSVAGRPQPAPARRVPTPPVPPGAPAPRRPLIPADGRAKAADQVRTARARARARRLSAHERVSARRGVGGRPNYTNSPGAPVALAGLLGLAVVFAIGFIVYGLVSAGSRNQVASVYSPYPVPAEVPGAQPWYPGTTLFPQPAPENPPASPAGVSVDRLPPPPPPAPALPAPSAAMPQIQAAILVVSDLNLPLSTETQGAVRDGFKLLEGQGAELAGDLVESDDPGMIELIASLRRDRGSVPIDSDDLPMRARAWLANRPFDAVLFIAPDPQGGPDPKAVLVTDRFFTRLGWKWAPEQFVRVLAGNGYVPE